MGGSHTECAYEVCEVKKNEGGRIRKGNTPMEMEQDLNNFYQPAVHFKHSPLNLILLYVFRFCLSVYILVCASALITCTSCTLLPCDFTLVDFGNLDGCFV